MTEGQGSDMTEGQGQRDDIRSGSESQQKVRVREMTGQDQGDNRMSGSGI